MNQIKGKINAGKINGSIKGQKIDGSIGRGVDYYKGEDGYTPIKGVDYFTEEDILEIISQIDIPSGGEDVEKVDYNLVFDKMIAMNGSFVITNPKEDIAEMIADFREGKANFIRELTLTYEPIDSLPKDGTILPSYEFCGDFVTNNAGTGHIICYRRIVAFTTAQTQQYIDILSITCNISTNKITNIVQRYVPLYDTIITSSDYNATSYPAPLTITSAGGLWGKQNPKLLKVARAGYASNFNFKLRVLTGNYNVWLNPVEAPSRNSLPMFIGESEELGKRIVVEFEDFTDDDNPAGTIYMEDLNTPSYELATDTGMTDWDSGKVVDAGALKTDFIQALGMLDSKVDSESLATVAFTGDYNDLINVPSGEEDDRYTYNLSLYMCLSSVAAFRIDNPKEDTAEMANDIKSGNAKLNRIINLTFDPIDALPEEGTVFPEYKLSFVQPSGSNTFYYYQRIISFYGNDYYYLDTLRFQFNNSTGLLAAYVYHYYTQLFDGIMSITDLWKDNPYPHAFYNFSSGGLFGRYNKKAAKTQKAGWLSKFNFKLRVNTHNDNVWLSPVETISANSIPRFIGESEKLGLRFVVTFDDFTDNDYPTGTINATEIITEDKVNDMIDAKLS